MFGYGGLVDHAGGNIRTTILAPALFVHPAGGLKLVFAPGVEYLDDEDETEFALRLGLAWDFEIKERYIVAPTVNVDFVDGEEIWVYGVNLGLRLDQSESPAEPLKRYNLRHTPEWRNWSVLTRRKGDW